VAARVFWDTNLFIYLMEDNDERAERVASIRRSMIDRQDILLASTMTLGELLVKPYRSGNKSLAASYRALFNVERVELIPFDDEAANIFGLLRAHSNVRPPDAIQLACAARAHADLFITNDGPLTGLRVPDIPFIVGLSKAPL